MLIKNTKRKRAVHLRRYSKTLSQDNLETEDFRKKREMGAIFSKLELKHMTVYNFM